jgi:hypothetical protein
LNEKCIGKIVEKIKINILFPIIFFFENGALYEIKWKNAAQPGSPQITIPRIHIACWMPETTNTHSQNM